MTNSTDYDSVLSYAYTIAEKYFTEFDTHIPKTQEVKNRLLEKVGFKIKDEYNIAKLNNMNTPEKVQSIVYNITKQIFARENISNFLNICAKDILITDDNFYMSGAYFDRKTRSHLRRQIDKFSFAICKYPLRFDNYQFTNKIIENPIIQTNYNNITFRRCEFLENVTLSSPKIQIEHTLEMKSCTFYKSVVINNKTFNSNVYFNNSIFKDFADFHESKFNQTACFYGVTFEKVPNFSQAVFNGNLNLVNSKLNFDFKDCVMAVENEFNKRTLPTSIPNETFPTLCEVANDFRDSFRICKNALIKENNLLDASNYHKIELYFKEIELDSKKPKIFSKEWIDLWQLKLYRITSDHHTDLLKSFNSLIILIGIFALFGLCIVAGFNAYCGFYDSNPHTMIKFYDAHIKNYVINNALIAFAFNAILTILFIGLFLVCQMCCYVRNITIYLYYILTCALLFSSPKYLIPAIGIFTDKRMIFDPLAVNGGLYTIFFGFMVYSFIKTARKHAIIST